MNEKGGKMDWNRIKDEYIKTKISQQELSLKYNVSRSTLAKRAMREKWREKRNNYATKVEQKSLDLSADKEAKRRAESLNKISCATEILIDKILTAVKDEDETVFDTKRVLEVTRSLKEAYEIIRNIQGVRNVKEQDTYNLQMQKLEIERNKSQTDDFEENTGVVIIPEIQSESDNVE